MAVIGPVPTRDDLPVAGDLARWTEPWRNWFSQVRLVCFAQQESGTTANRPTKNLYPGRRYFDTSLGANGKPIFVRNDGAGWVLADGSAA